LPVTVSVVSQTKFLVPNASAGVIIGKGGAYIKELKESSGAHVNVSHKGENPERIVTVSGEKYFRSKIGLLIHFYVTLYMP